MNPDVLASYTQNIGQGKENYSIINAVYGGEITYLTLYNKQRSPLLSLYKKVWLHI